MRHDDTRDNTTAIEATIIEADNRDMTPVDMDNPREGVFPAVVVREDAPAKILPIIVTVDELPPPPLKGFGGSTEVIVCEVRHEERNDGANGYDDEDDIEEDDGQPDEYTEWQDFMGGDEYYDHSENACW